jgi:predicted GNAT family acetyltransferase
MQLQRFDNIQEFWHDAQAYLLQHETENNLLLGILHTLLHNPNRYPQPPYLAIAKTHNDLLAVAILDQGSRCCFLLTDLANPTSNHIYREIGYRPMSDWHEFSFISKELEA